MWKTMNEPKGLIPAYLQATKVIVDFARMLFQPQIH